MTENDRTEAVSEIAGIRRFAQECHYEQPHADQVLRLSILLFKKLAMLHGLGDEDLLILRCAAVLHDIGWITGKKEHHKTAMQMILDKPGLPLSEEQRVLTALVVRYHRKAIPTADHAIYCKLTEPERKRVQMLGGILRIADGLDCRHVSTVQDIGVTIGPDYVEFSCTTQDEALPEMQSAQEKADLFELAFGCGVRIINQSQGGC